MSPLARAGRALVASSLAVAVLALAACTAPPAVVPDDAVLTPGGSVTQATVGPTGVALEGDDLTKRITLCLTRYGLAERPSLPDETSSAQERLSAQQLVDAYDATLTNCSAEALGTAVPAPAEVTPTPSS